MIYSTQTHCTLPVPRSQCSVAVTLEDLLTPAVTVSDMDATTQACPPPGVTAHYLESLHTNTFTQTPALSLHPHPLSHRLALQVLAHCLGPIVVTYSLGSRRYPHEEEGPPYAGTCQWPRRLFRQVVQRRGARRSILGGWALTATYQSTLSNSG